VKLSSTDVNNGVVPLPPSPPPHIPSWPALGQLDLHLYPIMVSPEYVQFVFVQTVTTRGADKSLGRPTSRCILFDGENISFDASLVIYKNSTNIPPVMIVNGIYEHQNLLSL
jgi:hypothetical protein